MRIYFVFSPHMARTEKKRNRCYVQSPRENLDNYLTSHEYIDNRYIIACNVIQSEKFIFKIMFMGDLIKLYNCNQLKLIQEAKFLIV